MRKAVGIAAMPLVAFASTARAEMNDVQIDWIISPDEWSHVGPGVGEQSITYRLRGVPQKLYSAVEDVVAADGTKLLPAGTQLYGMTGAKFAACSQTATVKKYAGSKNRICLRDENGDGYMDSYWLRPPAKKLFGKAEWFAMNTHGMQVSGSSILKPILSVIPSSEATMKMELAATILLADNGGGAVKVYVRDGTGFGGDCSPSKPITQSTRLTGFSCMVPDLVAQVMPTIGQDRKFSIFAVSTPQRDVRIRFHVSQGLLARSFEYMYFE